MISYSLEPQVDRHKTAIVWNDLSRPVRLAIEAGLFNSSTTAAATAQA